MLSPVVNPTQQEGDVGQTTIVVILDDILHNLANLVGPGQHIFFAEVFWIWRNDWGHLPVVTSTATSSTSASQLKHSTDCDLPRNTLLCKRTARFGKPELLACARTNGWS